MIPAMLLTANQIVHRRHQGDIVIEPFDEANLGSAQYDVRLGPHYWEMRRPLEPAPFYNQYSEASVRATWRQHRAQTPAQWDELDGVPIASTIPGINPADEVILVRPGGFLLCHTQEFIGGACPTITTQIKARSSMGRSGLTVCLCAGWGDHFYFSRWTLEVHNFTPYWQVLIVGRRVAQVQFFGTETLGVGTHASYGNGAGKYQHDGGEMKALGLAPGRPAHVQAVMAAWTPEAMLPRAYADREATAAHDALVARVVGEL